MASASRSVIKQVLSQETSEVRHRHAHRILKLMEIRRWCQGAGALVRRSIGSAQLRNLTPFLMLDHFHIGKGAVRRPHVSLPYSKSTSPTHIHAVVAGLPGSPASRTSYGHLHDSRFEQTRGLGGSCGYHPCRRCPMDVRCTSLLCSSLQSEPWAILIASFSHHPRVAEVSIISI